jgi:hypothetical protein
MLGEDFVLNFPGSHFQVEEESINVLIKTGLLDDFWTRNFLRKRRVFTAVKLMECGLG